eukprot:634425-Rhodomonas_salina.1
MRSVLRHRTCCHNKCGNTSVAIQVWQHKCGNTCGARRQHVRVGGDNDNKGGAQGRRRQQG